jgi:hypothetical protein
MQVSHRNLLVEMGKQGIRLLLGREHIVAGPLGKASMLTADISRHPYQIAQPATGKQ